MSDTERPLRQHPSGLFYIVGNEAAERFSYYGMKSILVVFMTTYLLSSDGNHAPMSEGEALYWYHLFGTANYVFPLLGAVVADTLLGKYRTIVYLSLVYCAGHAVLAIDATRLGLLWGLLLIAIGSGGIKPCVSAHLGDQYSPQQRSLLSKAYGWFYLSINIGAAISTLLVPYLLREHGAHGAFALPGILMALATVVFMAGRARFVALPPVPFTEYLGQFRDKGNRRRVLRTLALFALLSVFWSLFDQTGSSWTVQAQKLNRVVEIPYLGSVEIEAAQIQTLNPLLILILVPLFSMFLYPVLERRAVLSAERRIWIGIVMSAISFAIVGAVQLAVDSGESVSIGWQALAYLVLTAAEVLVSVTALEYAYIQAPVVSKSMVMSFYLLSVALGNFITAQISAMLSSRYSADTVVDGGYFFLFALLASLSALLIYFLFDKSESHV